MRTFCLKRRKKGGIAEKGGKRRNLTPCNMGNAKWILKLIGIVTIKLALFQTYPNPNFNLDFVL